MLILAAVAGAILYAAGVLTGAALYYRANQALPPLTLPAPKFRVRPAKKDDSDE